MGRSSRGAFPDWQSWWGRGLHTTPSPWKTLRPIPPVGPRFKIQYLPILPSSGGGWPHAPGGDEPHVSAISDLDGVHRDGTPGCLDEQELNFETWSGSHHRLRPSPTTISNSSGRTGWTDRRLFLVTSISSRPGVWRSVSRGTSSSNFSTNSIST